MTDNSGLYLLSIDMGTTHTKAVLYCHGKGIIGVETENYPTYYPRPHFVEQNPQEIFQAVIHTTRRVMQKSHVSPQAVEAVVFTGILQSLIPIDTHGQPLALASTWADTRSLLQNERLKQRLDSEVIKQRTGCTLHPMYFLSRLAWLRDEEPHIFHNAARFISIKEYVMQRLFGDYQLDHSIASGTGIWNMHTKNWDAELLAEIGLTPDRFSECIEPTAYVSGGLKREYADQMGLLPGTPAVAGAFDGGLSHLGSVGLSDKKMSLTVGTGAALRRTLRNTPRVIPGSEAWCYYLADDNWLLGGVMHDAGNAMRWFADHLMFTCDNPEETFRQMNDLAAGVAPGADGLFFIPMLGGERCPHYRPDASGALLGLTFSHGRAHMVRALMEGLAYNLYSIYEMLAPETDQELVVTGGILKSPVWLKIVADLFGKPLWLPAVQETSAWGGVILSLRSVGVLASLDEAEAYVSVDGKQDFNPMLRASYRQIIAEYDRLSEENYRLGLGKNNQEA
jgi:gluconokinase